MSTVTVNGLRVITASVTIPFYGAWSADVAMALPDDILGPDGKPTDTVKLVLGDLALTGTIRRKATFGASRSLRIVGGFGGWRKVIPARAYSQPTGIRLSTVLRDAASESGESIVVNQNIDPVIGTAYVREEAKAERVLALETAGAWWIDGDGATQLAPRPSPVVAAPFTVVKQLGGKGQFEIATEAISQWLPNARFTAPTVGGEQTVSSISIEADNNGKLRLIVLSTSGATERLLTDLRALIRAEVATLSYGGEWEYTIARSDAATVDATSNYKQMPDLTNVPMRPGLLGEIVTATVGAKCRIVFVNMDPKRPECIGIVGPTVNSAYTASASVGVTAGTAVNVSAGSDAHHTVGGLFKVNGASDFVALAALCDANFSTLQSNLDAHIHPTGVGPSGPSLTPFVSFPSVKCTKMKTD